MTVQDLIDRLHDPVLPRNAEIRFATSPGSEYELASAYWAPSGIVWIDLEPTEDYAAQMRGEAMFDDR